MKRPEFSLDSLKKNRTKNKNNSNYENFSAHHFLKIPIFIILIIAFALNAFIYLLIRFFIYIFENTSFFIVTTCIDVRRYISNKKRKVYELFGRKKVSKLKCSNKNEINNSNKEINKDFESVLKVENLMKTCNNYCDYIKYAHQMDFLTGKIIHINENDDYINVYDVNLLKKTSKSIENNLLNGNILLLLEDIKIATSPRIKAIFQEKYYCKTYSTPHIIITTFINNVMNGLNYIENYVKERKEKNENYLYSDEYLIIKNNFKDIFRQWGNTALFLSGGAILGLHHFGVLEVFLKSSINIDYFNEYTNVNFKNKKKQYMEERQDNEEKFTNNKYETFFEKTNTTIYRDACDFNEIDKKKKKKKLNTNKLLKIKKFLLNTIAYADQEIEHYDNFNYDSCNCDDSDGSISNSNAKYEFSNNHTNSFIRLGSYTEKCGIHVKNNYKYIKSQNEINIKQENNANIKSVRNKNFNNNKSKRHIIDKNCFIDDNDNNILPQIICGTSAGSIIAAWICSRTNKELLEEFNIEFIYKIVSCFSSEKLFYSFFNIFKKGNFYDMDKIIKLVYDLYGDMTFLEAFIKTNLVLNITVTRAESGNDIFTCDEDGCLVLNYMNSPNVLIYTAVLASCSFPYLLQPFKLLEKKYIKENVYKFISIKQVYNLKYILNSNSAYNKKISIKGSQESHDIMGSNKSDNDVDIINNTENVEEDKIDTYNNKGNKILENNIINNINKNDQDCYNNLYYKENTNVDIKLDNETLLTFDNTYIGNKENPDLKKNIKKRNIKKIDSLENNEANIETSIFNSTTEKNKLLDHQKEHESDINSEQIKNDNKLSNSQIKETLSFKFNNIRNKMMMLKSGSLNISKDEKNENLKKCNSELIDFNEYKNIDLLNEEYTIIDSVQFKNMYFHDGSLKSDIPARNLNQILSVKYKIVSQVNPHIFPFTGVRVHGEAGKPVKWRGSSGRWRAGFLMSSMEILFKENVRYILRLMALLDISPTIRGLNAGSIAMQRYHGDITLHPNRLFLKHFKLISVSSYDDVEWYIQEGRQMTFQKLPLIMNRMKIEKKLIKVKKCFF
ncbi:patatin-like phospholipase, putative [Plasmodium berghei]|uniref:Patatin-like phospholipase, putative n=2 Tax=Plasmodium berghei TaxID=5821 RepID=A0A509AKQ6_PLABA|nr:patatin-like phospholipase, putative [Plasmodium berghei ANKA]CXI34623.1 patatin-like phospholipase, putative [Plasmodium berghei]SCM21403.1 patatin-like phospholipase, putative [Plasmodium berghei]SCN24638.1 patatin-like phospholipase, putative [Plasmodium berghei]SCO59799.1 patatin-like phospholipase, putative [Plasmodium berghei]SCO61066.1 patatin-like phospholipase, putative [Plasmodium berghei]|eukprot:XP_034421221.1 patatin-like phospholipase, putative [Plasmodium berghei ANKA]